MTTAVNQASYDDALDSKWKIVDVPLRIATEENFREYGRLVPDLEKEEVSTTSFFLNFSSQFKP